MLNRIAVNDLLLVEQFSKEVLQGVLRLSKLKDECGDQPHCIQRLPSQQILDPEALLEDKPASVRRSGILPWLSDRRAGGGGRGEGRCRDCGASRR